METAAAATIAAVDLEGDAILYCCYGFAEAKGEFINIVDTCHQSWSLYTTGLFRCFGVYGNTSQTNIHFRDTLKRMDG